VTGKENSWKILIKGIYNKFRVFVDFGPSYNGEVLFPEETVNPPVVTTENALKYDMTMPNLTMSLYGFIHSTFLIASTTVLGPSISVRKFQEISLICRRTLTQNQVY
jgi:hypothetical protein